MEEIVVVAVLKMGHDWSLLPMRSDPSVICENDDQNLSLDMQWPRAAAVVAAALLLGPATWMQSCKLTAVSWWSDCFHA